MKKTYYEQKYREALDHANAAVAGIGSLCVLIQRHKELKDLLIEAFPYIEVALDESKPKIESLIRRVREAVEEDSACT